MSKVAFRLFVGLFVAFVVLAGSAEETKAFFWDGPEVLATINGVDLTEEDYSHWWKEWREEDSSVAEGLESFIDWMLLFQEADRMRLFEKPTYRQKVSVFRKVRSLMMLKNEEVGRRIALPTTENLKALYYRDYAPVLKFKILKADTEEQAKEIQAAVDSGLSLEEVAQKSEAGDASGKLSQTGATRPEKVPPLFRSEVFGLKVGEISAAVAWQGAWYFFEVFERENGSEEDFESFRAKLKRQWLKEKEGRLTLELIDRLKKKYEVVVDEDLLATIGPEGVLPEDAQKPVITMTGVVINAETVWQATVKETSFRGRARMGGVPDFEDNKRRVVADMISQTTTGMEALARHYEQQEPFKYTYQFYCQRRMIKEIEKELVWPQVKITDEDIAREYIENPDSYSRSGVVEAAVVKTNEVELAGKLERRLKAGEDFFTVMRTLVPEGVKTQKKPVAHFDQTLQTTINELSPGQVSDPVNVGEEVCFVKLIRREEKELRPLEEVAESINNRLVKERFAEKRFELLDNLKRRSSIEINRRVWKDIQNRLLREKNADQKS